MYSEHWIYSTAIAIIIYTIYKKNYVMPIIILSSYSPDIDILADKILKNIGITVLVYGEPIKHGNFHNIAVLVLYGFLAALILQIIGIKLIDSLLLASIGFGAHLFEDALVFNPGYRFFWPVSDKIYGIGLIKYYKDLYGIANKEVLIIGIILVIISIVINIIYEKWKYHQIIHEKLSNKIFNILNNE